MRAIAVIVILALALTARIAYQRTFRSGGEEVPLRKPFEKFTLGFAGDGWTEDRQELDKAILRKAGVSDYLNLTFEKEKILLWLYLGYYDGRSVESIHQPEVCFPGSGWHPQKRQIETLDVKGFGAFPVNLILFTKSGYCKLTAYTFYYRGQFIPDQDAIERGRVFGEKNFAILTVAADLPDAQEPSVEKGKKTLLELLERILPRIMSHLPVPTVETNRPQEAR